MAAGRGQLSNTRSPDHTKHTLCVTLTSEAYPDLSERNDVIFGIEAAENSDVLVFPAGVAATAGGQLSTGGNGRILNVVGVAGTLKKARSLAYGGVGLIEFPGKKYRSDIGAPIIESTS
ncbi:MAG TPA: phosphoribosylglycinamide synthetase C domain-containing protein [Candidatus Paceibacterota bacterium]